MPLVPHRSGLRLLSGGREEIRLGTLHLRLAPASEPPFTPAAVAAEEDTWQVLSADPRLRPPGEHPVRVMTGLLDAAPLAPGSVLLRAGVPLKLLAVVYDFDQAPCCRPEWVAACYAALFHTVAERRLHSLALPLLGLRHGRLSVAAAGDLLLAALAKAPRGRLTHLWLVVPTEAIGELSGRLRQAAAGKLSEQETTMDARIEKFLASPAFGVVGASVIRHKYGNRVLRCYLQNGKKAIPVNPKETEIEGVACVASVAGLPAEVKSLSVITPPAVTEQVVAAAIEKGIDNIWMQPGAESQAAVELCRKAGVNVIADGSCLLVVMGFHDH